MDTKDRENIGIVILATNAYFILGIRFIKRFMHFYKGDKKIQFYFFSDKSPDDFLPENIDVHYYFTANSNWVDGTNLKFSSILNLRLNGCYSDWLFYFDADTNIDKDFTEEWFLGDMVGGQHYADQGWMKEVKGYDRNPESRAYIPFDTTLPQTYFYGAFFGGLKERVFEFCDLIMECQIEDKKIPYEPSVNDESYINREFHYNRPTVVPNVEFKFLISDKGGIGETRNPNLECTNLITKARELKYKLFDIRNGEIYADLVE